MAIDPSRCQRTNVTDTCSVWNLLSSRVLYEATVTGKFSFCITFYVLYEALFKRRKNTTPAATELQERLKGERGRGRFADYHLDIADLQDMHVLERRKRIGKGELSSIVFAKKTRQAFLTDDQQARKLAAEILEKDQVQTTPHVVSALFFEGLLSDGDKTGVIQEHTTLDRPLAGFFEDAYMEALRCRCLARGLQHEVGEGEKER